MPKVIDGKEYKTFDDIYCALSDCLTDAEKAEIELNVELAGAIIEAREKQGISQRQLAELSGVKQPAIARIERAKTSPRIDTYLKVITPLGYKLALIPIREVYAESSKTDFNNSTE